MSNKGWVKIDRGLLDNELWSTPEPFDVRAAWIDLILMANHKDAKIFGGKDVKRGDVNRSVLFLADRWGWSRGKVRRFLEKLEREQMASVNSTTSGTTITLINYGKYQVQRPTVEPTNGQQTDNERTTDGHIQEYIKNDKNVKKEEEGDARAREGAAAIPLEDGTEYIITNTQLVQLVLRYPGLDVRRELIRAVNWCKDNPEKLKPRSGAWRFVTGWLTRAEKDREAAEAAPVVVRSAAAKNSFHNFEEREDTHLDDLFPGDIVNAEVG